MSSPDSMMPVPSTNLGPSGGEGSSRGQGKVKAHIVSGMTVCMLSDCTTLPGQTHRALSLVWSPRIVVTYSQGQPEALLLKGKASTHSTHG